MYYCSQRTGIPEKKLKDISLLHVYKDNKIHKSEDQ